MGQDLVIDSAGPDQAPEVAQTLAAFNAEFGSPAPPTGEIESKARRLLARGDITVLLCGERPDGLALISFRPTVWADGPIAMLEELYVVPDKRRQGIGRALLAAVIARARAAGCGWIELGTGESDATARALYESFGFTNFEDSTDRPRMLYYEREL